MGLDARRANRRSVLITDVHISGADCICQFIAFQYSVSPSLEIALKKAVPVAETSDQ